MFQSVCTETRGRRHRGYRLYAVDGDQLNLPATTDVLEHGFRGYPSSKQRETYYPKMYTAQILDVLNATICGFKYSVSQDEIYMARDFVNSLESKSITLYDRLYCGYRTFRNHAEAGNFFIVRARADARSVLGRGVHREVRALAKSKLTTRHILWKAQTTRRIDPPIQVRGVKTKNAKTGKLAVFITNLPERYFSARQIAKLYRKRWEIETAFSDVTRSLKLGQWHSKKLNGILQEIYVLLWFYNCVKAETIGVCSTEDCALARRYRKTNFKMVCCCALDHFGELIRGDGKKFYGLLRYWIRKTSENRCHDSRSYPRVVKHRGKEYKQCNLVYRRQRA